MRFKLTILFVILGFFAVGCAHQGHQQQGEDHAAHMAKGEDHSAHMAMMKKPSSYKRTLKTYPVPDVTMLNQDGQKVNLPAFLETSEPYALNFIFTSCTTICPIMSATFSQMQRELGTEAKDLRMISISIDPEYDKPKRLKDYIEKFQMGDNFTFLTGDLDVIIAVEKAFDSYTPDKMQHRPFTIFKEAGSSQWVRIDGLASGTSLADEYRQLISN